jgi:hypothetical protein
MMTYFSSQQENFIFNFDKSILNTENFESILSIKPKQPILLGLNTVSYNNIDKILLLTCFFIYRLLIQLRETEHIRFFLSSRTFILRMDLTSTTQVRYKA